MCHRRDKNPLSAGMMDTRYNTQYVNLYYRHYLEEPGFRRMAIIRARATKINAGTMPSC